MIVKDAHDHTLGEYHKADGSFHLHSKFGEYTVDDNGKVSLQPSQKDFDGAKLHKAGTIAKNHLEDYGISSGGGTIRFPNGVNYDTKTHKIVIEQQFSKNRISEDQNSDGSRVFRSGDKVLYRSDQNGLHIPTPDGTITMNGKGEFSFEPNK